MHFATLLTMLLSLLLLGVSANARSFFDITSLNARDDFEVPVPGENSFHYCSSDQSDYDVRITNLTFSPRNVHRGRPFTLSVNGTSTKPLQPGAHLKIYARKHIVHKTLIVPLCSEEGVHCPTNDFYISKTVDIPKMVWGTWHLMVTVHQAHEKLEKDDEKLNLVCMRGKVEI